jgi:hypothetical protein
MENVYYAAYTKGSLGPDSGFFEFRDDVEEWIRRQADPGKYEIRESTGDFSSVD